MRERVWHFARVEGVEGAGPAVGQQPGPVVRRQHVPHHPGPVPPHRPSALPRAHAHPRHPRRLSHPCKHSRRAVGGSPALHGRQGATAISDLNLTRIDSDAIRVRSPPPPPATTPKTPGPRPHRISGPDRRRRPRADATGPTPPVALFPSHLSESWDRGGSSRSPPRPVGLPATAGSGRRRRSAGGE